jgi:hypothetical protein
MLKLKCFVFNRDRQRQLLSFDEQPDGTVFVRNYSGLQVGHPPNNQIISEDRYSVHSSLSDPVYNTITQHLAFKSGIKSKKYLRTDAIKSGAGFCHMFTMRYSSLDSRANDVTPNRPGFISVKLADFDADVSCFILSLFVGHKDTPSLVEDDTSSLTEFVSGIFKFQILTTLGGAPALDEAKGYKSFTSGDDVFGPNHRGFPHHFHASSAQECMMAHNNFMRLAMIDLFETAIKLGLVAEDDPGLIEDIAELHSGLNMSMIITPFGILTA